MRDPKTSRSHSMQIVGQDASRVGFYSYDLINYSLTDSFRIEKNKQKQSKALMNWPFSCDSYFLVTLLFFSFNIVSCFHSARYSVQADSSWDIRGSAVFRLGSISCAWLRARK